jgi:dihydrofolate synthase / folylpolyglutamate synthase
VNFQEAESYLLSLGNEVETMKLGLHNIRLLLAALGNPEKKYLKVQVAGTNGKGSVCAFLDSICLRAGIKTGVFTSPHLMSITERIRIGGVDIAEAEFARIATIVRETSERLVASGELETVPTYFEQVTAIALVAFAEAKVELAILETGLGGRYDAVTAANAEICALTRIDLDHQEYLGSTIAQIAQEKAAIIRQDSKVSVLHQSREVEQVIIGRCREVAVVPNWASTRIELKSVLVEPAIMPYVIATFQTQIAVYPRVLFPNMFGMHQVENASVAIGVVEVLIESGFEIATDDVVYGIEDATHPGRLEYTGDFLLDGAHNIGGAKALRAYLDEFVDKPITLIFGAMKEKSVAGIAQIIFSKVDTIILTQPSNSRAMAAEDLRELVPKNVSNDRIFQTDSVADAIRISRELVPTEGIILVTGSLYLVGEVKKLLNN